MTTDVKDQPQEAVEDPSLLESPDSAQDEATLVQSEEQADQSENASDKEPTIPKSRLDEVIAQRNEERQARLALEERLSKLEQSQQDSKPKTWDDIPIEQLYTAHDNFIDSGEEHKARELQKIIIRREAKEASRAEIGEVRAQQAKVTNWQQATQSLKEYSEKISDPDFDLSNENSKIRQVFVEIYSNKKLQADPEGISVAAEMASNRLLKEKFLSTSGKTQQLKQQVAKSNIQTQLEGSSRANTPPSSIEKMEKDAFDEPDPFARTRKIKNYLSALEKQRRAK